ncbi:MAG: serpin family protein, partial [Clostridiales bacterium]|nr:serpin family protein [Clostridiales bacterium]
PEKPIEFICDRPFTYLIRDNETGEILFIGRYNNAE